MMQNQRWSRAPDAPRVLRPRLANRPRNSPVPARRAQNQQQAETDAWAGDWVGQTADNWSNGGLDKKHTVKKDPAWGRSKKENVEIPEGCEGLMDWDGDWAHAPVDWEGRPSFDISDGQIQTWLEETFNELEELLEPMPFELLLEFKGREMLAVFTDVIRIGNRVMPRPPPTDPSIQIITMGHIVPRWWIPENLENNLNAETFWEYFRTTAPVALDNNEGLQNGSIQPYWRYYPSPDAYFMKEIVDEIPNPINPNEESPSQRAARENDWGSNGFIEEYYERKRKAKAKGRKGKNRESKPRHENHNGQPGGNSNQQHNRGSAAQLQEQDHPTLNPAMNTTCEADWPSLPIANTPAAANAPPSPPITTSPKPGATAHPAAPPATTTPQPWVSSKPPIEILIRHASDLDIPQMTSLYNHHIKSSLCVPERTPLSKKDMRERLNAIHGADFPFLVAVRARTSTIVGMIYADDFNDSQGLYRFTCELEVFVSPHHCRKGVGTALMQEMLGLLDVGHFRNQVAGVETAAGLECGKRRVVKSLVVHLPYQRRERPEWVLKWLGGFGWKEAGLLEEVGYKGGKKLDLAMLQRMTGEEIEAGKVLD